MEIHVLKATCTEADLNGIMQKHLPSDVPMEDLKLRVTPAGVQCTGVYPLFVRVAFETLWELRVVNGIVESRLAQLKALGIPGNVFRSAILKVLQDSVKKEDALTVRDDVLLIDVDRLLRKHGVASKTNLRQLTCGDGTISLEAGE